MKENKKSKLKKMFEFIWQYIYPALCFLGSIFLFIFAAKDYHNKKKIKKINWQKIPGKKNQVKVLNKEGKWEIVNLPKIEGKQLTVDEIEHIGITEKEGEYAARIKHEIKNRRNIIVDNNNTSMDI